MDRRSTQTGPLPFGLLQNIADFLKLLGKEILLPAKSDRVAMIFALFIIVTTRNIMGLPLDLVLTQGNIILGIGVSGFIGLLSGFIPAYSASKLNPVDAMRSSF